MGLIVEAHSRAHGEGERGLLSVNSRQTKLSRGGDFSFYRTRFPLPFP